MLIINYLQNHTLRHYEKSFYQISKKFAHLVKTPYICA